MGGIPGPFWHHRWLHFGTFFGTWEAFCTSDQSRGSDQKEQLRICYWKLRQTECCTPSENWNVFILSELLFHSAVCISFNSYISLIMRVVLWLERMLIKCHGARLSFFNDYLCTLTVENKQSPVFRNRVSLQNRVLKSVYITCVLFSLRVQPRSQYSN